MCYLKYQTPADEGRLQALGEEIFGRLIARPLPYRTSRSAQRQPEEHDVGTSILRALGVRAATNTYTTLRGLKLILLFNAVNEDADLLK